VGIRLFRLFYLLFALFIYFGIKSIKGKNRKVFIRFILKNFLFVFVALLLSAGILVSVYMAIPYITRGDGITLSKALFGPFSPQSTISFLLPFVSIAHIEFYQTDLSMTNAYFGIIFFVFFAVGTFTKKGSVLKIFFGFALFALLASFGGYFPVREFLYDYVPLMNSFRFPSAFRLFVIIGFVLIAANGLNHFLLHEWNNRKKLITTIASLMLLFIVLIVFSRTQGYLSLLDFVKHDLFTFSKTDTLRQHVAFQAGIQIVLLGSFLLIVKKVNNVKTFVMFMALIVATDMLLSAQLNAPYTVYYNEFSSAESNAHINKFPKGFPMLPDTSIAANNPNEVYFGPFWKNVNTFQKQISADGLNPFSFKNHEALQVNTPTLYSKIIENKIVYLSDKIHSQEDLIKMQQDSSFTSKSLFFKAKDYAILSRDTYQTNVEDVATLTNFQPCAFAVNTNTSKPQVLTLMQNYYIGWEAFINDKSANIYISNQSLISVVLPAGKNTVRFVYTDNTVKIAAFVSISTLILLLTTLIIYSKKSTIKNG
jgi:hypothetical protein